MSKFNDILNSSDANDDLLGEQIDKLATKAEVLDAALKAKVDKTNAPIKIYAESGNLVLQVALNYMYPDATDFRLFLVSITYDDGNFYLGYFRYKKNVNPDVIDIGKSSGITAVNVNSGGTISPAGVTGTAHFSIIGLS